MKKLILPILFIFIFLSACNSNTVSETVSSSMPEMTVKANGKAYKAVVGSYCWQSDNQAVCADASGDPFDYRSYTQPIQVKSGEIITIEFSSEPTNVDIALHAVDGPSTKVESNPFSSPLESGLYGYSVFTEWKQGDISYMFLIEVE